MSSGVTSATRDLKKLLGNPKIIFVIGGPASGKSTQCEKIVEEFGFTHISIGDLLRQEIDKKTKEGEKIAQIVKEGKLVPFEVTVPILINGLISQPSKTYLIDGFPRAVDQAKYFEKTVLEAHQILYYHVPEELMVERALKRAEEQREKKEGPRQDDSKEIIQGRVDVFKAQNPQVVDYYTKFGKVVKIDATAPIADVYAETKRAILPQCISILGPKCSGKTSIGQAMAARTNMRLIDFNQFVLQNGLQGQKDEVITAELIKSLSKEKKPRIVLENFPRNMTQAKYFIRNGTTPSNVFSLSCSKDICQERLIDLGQNHPNYVSSPLLSKKIKLYHEQAKDLLPLLKEATNFQEISTDQCFDKTMQEVSRHIEPLVIHVRPGSTTELKDQIIKGLEADHGFVNLDVSECIKGENERGTMIGKEFYKLVVQAKVIPAEMIVRMLNKIIYSGQEAQNKFILSNFPDIIEQAREFERNCANIAAMIYPSSSGSVVEIKNNNLSLYNIDSLFQKEFRLKTMDAWNYQLFDEKLGNKVSYGIISGKQFSGKSFVAGKMAEKLGYTVLDMKATEAQCKAELGTPEEPYEGDVAIEKIEEKLLAQISSASNSAQKPRFVFDGFAHKSEADFLKFTEQLGLPDFILLLTAELDTIKERYMKKEGVEEVNDDALETIKADSATNGSIRQAILTHFEAHSDKIEIIHFPTDGSEETVVKEIGNKFSPKVILVNHEKHLPVDTTCANLAIKYNMIYMSAYQIIKHHIEHNTLKGQKLLKGMKKKTIQSNLQIRDEFKEAEYSPVHFDLASVMTLLKETITEKRTNQKFVLLEGLCNNSKLRDEDDQMELRYMDELFSIEAIVGEVAAVISLQNVAEPEFMRDDQIEYEKFPDPPPVEEKKKKDGEDDDSQAPVDDPPVEEEDPDKPKVPAFRKEDYKWTVSNRQPKNLPQLYLGCKGINTLHEVKQAGDIDSNAPKAIARSLDDFCARLQDADNSDKYLYQQVIFN